MRNRANVQIFADNQESGLQLGTAPAISADAAMTTDTEFRYPAPSHDVSSVVDEWIREDERKRIAQDIHDELGQQILVLRMDIQGLRSRIAKTHPQLQVFIDGVLQQLDTTVQSVRTIIRDLRPAVLDLGLRSAAEWQCVEFMRRTGIACDLKWMAGDIAIPDRCTTALFRTLQESLTNVHQHSLASRVSITVYTNNKHIVMTVSDNGIGSAPVDQAKRNSFGLSCMRERITALGGKLAIDSVVHEGMTLTASLPI